MPLRTRSRELALKRVACNPGALPRRCFARDILQSPKSLTHARILPGGSVGNGARDFIVSAAWTANCVAVESFRKYLGFVSADVALHPPDPFFAIESLCRSRRLALELNVAFLGNRRLLDGDHLALHLPELRGCLLVATDKEGRWPEDHDGRGGRVAILSPLTVLCTGQCGGASRHRLSLKPELLAIV